MKPNKASQTFQQLKPICLLLSLIPLSALAEEDKQLQQLPDIVVEGELDNEELTGQTYGYSVNSSSATTKNKQALKNTARAVSVVTRQQIEDQRPASISQALNYSAGAFTGLVGAANRYDYVAIRGFNENMTDNVLVDGQKLLSDSNTFSSMQIDPYFIERIDLVKGPVSATYGRATPGGVVAATTKRPLHDAYHEINLAGGNFKQRMLSFDLTDKIDPAGKFSYRLTGLNKVADSQNSGLQSKRFTIAPSLSWHITPATNLLLQAYIQNDPEGGYHSGLPADGMINDHKGFKFSREFSDMEPTDRFKRRQNIYSYQLHHAFNGDWLFASKMRYANVHLNNRQTWHLGWVNDRTLGRAGANSFEYLKSFAFDNHVSGKLYMGDITHTVLIGSDYQRRKTDIDQSYSYGEISPLDVYNPQYDNKTYRYGKYANNQALQLTQVGFYISDAIQWNQWFINVGVRHDRVKNSITDLKTDTVVSDWNGNKTTGQASILYALDNGFSPYVSYSTGFNPNTYKDKNNKLLKATESRQLEAGLKYQTPGSNNLYTLSLYDIEQKNVANRVINGNYYIPSGKTRSKGVEFEAKTELNRQWFLQAALSYGQTEFKNNINGLDGKTPYQAPEWVASLWSNYEFDNGLSLSGGMRHISGVWADHKNTLKVPAYTLLDVSVRYNFGKLDARYSGLEASLSINNLLDKTYVSSCAGLNYCYYGEGRNVLANISYRW